MEVDCLKVLKYTCIHQPCPSVKEADKEHWNRGCSIHYSRNLTLSNIMTRAEESYSRVCLHINLKPAAATATYLF